MATNEKMNQVEQQAADQALIDGLTKYAQTFPVFFVGGTSFKTSDIIATLQACLTAADAVQPLRAAWLAAVKAKANQRASAKKLVLGVKQQLQVMFDGSIDTLAEFGLKPRKERTAPTPEQQILTAARAKATRAARHTMGTKQKKAIKGTTTTIISS